MRLRSEKIFARDESEPVAFFPKPGYGAFTDGRNNAFCPEVFSCENIRNMDFYDRDAYRFYGVSYRIAVMGEGSGVQYNERYPLTAVL